MTANNDQSLSPDEQRRRDDARANEKLHWPDDCSICSGTGKAFGKVCVCRAADAKRATLSDALRHAALDLLEHNRAAGACIEIEGEPPMYVLVGHAAAMGKMLPEAAHVARQTQAAPVGSASQVAELVELLNAIQPNYGAVGSRDVDVTAQRKRIDRAIELLSAGAPQAERAAVPEVLFDGKAVYDEVMANDPHTPRPTADNIADVLDAVVRLMRRSAPVAQEGGRELGSKMAETRMDTGLEAGREVVQEVEPGSAQAVPEGWSEAQRDAVRDTLSATLGGAMDCTRVWSAWGVGTMSQDDFQLLADNDERLDELVCAVEAAVIAAQAAPAEQIANVIQQMIGEGAMDWHAGPTGDSEEDAFHSNDEERRALVDLVNRALAANKAAPAEQRDAVRLDFIESRHLVLDPCESEDGIRCYEVNEILGNKEDDSKRTLGSGLTARAAIDAAMALRTTSTDGEKGGAA